MARETTYRLVLVCCGIVIAIVIAEITARIVLRTHPSVIRYSDHGYAAGGNVASQPDSAALQRHPEEGFVYVQTPTGRRLRPNVHAVILNHKISKRRIDIRTNSLGYRNREIGPKRGTRILFLGDSITFGDFLPEDETFVRVIEAMAAADSRDWETVNAGVGAVSLKTEIAILMETGLSLEPDVIVLCFYLNDFVASQGIFIQDIPGPIARSRLATYLWLAYQQRSLGQRSMTDSDIDIRQWFEEYKQHLARDWPEMTVGQRALHHEVLKAFGDWGGAWSPHAWEHMGPLFEGLKRLADDHGSRLVIVAFPVKLQVEAISPEAYPQDRLNEIGSVLSIPVLDLLPALREAHASNARALFYDHCHHTPEGNRVVAAIIYRFLLDLEAGETG